MPYSRFLAQGFLAQVITSLVVAIFIGQFSLSQVETYTEVNNETSNSDTSNEVNSEVKRELTVHNLPAQSFEEDIVIPSATTTDIEQDDIELKLTLPSNSQDGNSQDTDFQDQNTQALISEESSGEIKFATITNKVQNEEESTGQKITKRELTIHTSPIQPIATILESTTNSGDIAAPNEIVLPLLATSTQDLGFENTGERQLTVHTALYSTRLQADGSQANGSQVNGSQVNGSQAETSQSALSQLTNQITPASPLAKEDINVGRLMMVAFEQSDMQTQTILESFQPGGFAFFPGDIVSTLQIQSLTASLQEKSAHPLIFAIDQEGGPFTSYRIDEATLFPGAMMLAATNDTELARRVGEATAKELNYAGLTMNFAPVADVNSNPDNPIIGIRSFGDDPAKVSAFSQAFAKGSMSSGVASVTKHFPGHGNTTTDSHIGLPRIESSLEEMRTTDLEPFQNNLNSSAVMTAHILFPALDDVWPATLSHKILTDLLRTDMGYECLVITDSLVMGALTRSYSAGTIAVKAINAGADLLLVGANFNEQQTIYNALERAVETGEIPLWRVKEAIGRIDKLATSYTSLAIEEVPDYEEHRQLALEVALKGTTVVNDSAQVIPIDKELSVSVIAPRPRGFGTPPHLGTVLDEFMPNVKRAEVSVNPNWSQINNAVAVSQNADVIVLGVYYWLGEFPARMRELYKSLQNLGKPVIIVSLGNPNIETHLDVVPDAHIAAFGYRYSNLYGASAVLAGKIEAVGVLPVELSSGTE